MKCYQPEVYFASKIEDKNKEEFVEVITLSLSKIATFLVTIASVNCNTLIHTSATRSSISETFYNQLMLLWLLKAFILWQLLPLVVPSVQWELCIVHLN